MSDKEAIDLSQALGYEEVQVPELGKSLKIRAYTLGELKWILDKNNGDMSAILYCALKDNYEVTKEQIDAWPYKVGLRIKREVDRINGLRSPLSLLEEYVNECPDLDGDAKKLITDKLREAREKKIGSPPVKTP